MYPLYNYCSVEKPLNPESSAPMSHIIRWIAVSDGRFPFGAGYAGHAADHLRLPQTTRLRVLSLWPEGSFSKSIEFKHKMGQ